MWKFTAIFLFFICTVTFAQTTREEWSKAFKDSKPNIENYVAAMVRGINRSKGKMIDEVTLNLGATSANRIIVTSYQLTTHEFTSNEALNAKKILYELAIKKSCNHPIFFVMLNEYDMKINHRYFDKNMKEVIEFVVEKIECN
jgi:hypothetical protein